MIPFLAAFLLQTPAATPTEPALTQAELERISDTIRGEIEDLRGLEFRSSVAVRLTDKQGFVDYAKKRQAETEPPEKVRRDETVAKLLGLLPPTYEYEQELLALLESQVGGFYDPGSDTFYLMNTFTGGVAKVILAHELTHALDDQHFDLDAKIRACGDDTDATLALQSVMEGSGTGLMNQWWKRHAQEVSPADLAAAQSNGAEALAEAPPYLWKPLLCAYLRGDGFLVHVPGLNVFLKAATREDVVRAFEAPPRSTEQILHPAKYWKASERDDPLHVDLDAAALPPEWKLAGTDTLGELYLSMLSTPRAKRTGLDASNALAMAAIAYTNKAAEGWGGDRLALFRRGDDAFLQLVTAWDTPADADEFAEALGDAQHPDVIPTFTAAERTRANGWFPGATPTQVRITRQATGDGIAVVVVRVFSFAGSAPDEAELGRLLVPFHVARPTAPEPAK